MEIDVEDLDLTVLRKMVFLVGKYRIDEKAIYFSEYERSEGTCRWLVLDAFLIVDSSAIDYKLYLYSTEEMKVLVQSIRYEDGKPLKAPKRIVYRLLVQSGALRIKVKEGCTGCQKFWDTTQGLFQCRQCKRCHKCCRKADVNYSCAYREAERVRKWNEDVSSGKPFRS